MEHTPTSGELITAGAILGGGLLCAMILGLGLSRLVDRAKRTESTTDDLVLKAVRDLVQPATVLLGIWLALVQLPIRSTVRRTVDQWLVAIFVLVVTYVAAGLAAKLTAILIKDRDASRGTSLFSTVVRIVVFAIGVLIFLGTLGISITPLLTALGVGGLAVALALQDTLSNLFAGIHLLASKKIQPGDYVKLSSGDEGYVIDVNWRNTSIRALPDNMILVPNAKLSSEVVVNYHRPFPQMSVLVQVGVSYDSDLDEVERITVEVAREVMRGVDGGVPEHEPFIRYHTFGSSSIDFSVILRAREFTDQYALTHEFIKRLHRRYGAEGIQIPFPIRTVQLETTELEHAPSRA